MPKIDQTLDSLPSLVLYSEWIPSAKLWERETHIMRRREYYWSLFHVPEKNQLDSLRTDQVEAVFAAIAKRHHKEWLIWRDGFDAWKPFEDFPQLLISLRKVEANVAETAPPPPFKKEITKSGAGKKNLAGKTLVRPRVIHQNQVMDSVEGNAFDLSLMPTGAGEDRNNFRFDKDFEVRVLNGEKAYPNKTLNISLKGMQLKNPLPKNLPRYFNVEIRSGNRMIPIVCSEVRGEGGWRLKIEVNDFTPALLAMLLSG